MSKEAEIITDDEDSVSEDPEGEEAAVAPHCAAFNTDGQTSTPDSMPVIIKDEEDPQTTNASAEFLCHHHKHNHIPPRKTQMMAKQGILP